MDNFEIEIVNYGGDTVLDSIQRWPRFVQFVEMSMDEGPQVLLFGCVFLILTVSMTYLVDWRIRRGYLTQVSKILPLLVSTPIVICALAASTAAYLGIRHTELPWNQTEYADGYSKRAFLTIRRGDSADLVRSRLGEPLDIWPVSRDPERIRWDYSQTERYPVLHNFFRRAVVIDTDRMTVVDVVSGFFLHDY